MTNLPTVSKCSVSKCPLLLYCNIIFLLGGSTGSGIREEHRTDYPKQRSPEASSTASKCKYSTLLLVL